MTYALYTPMETVDEQADLTQMSGQATQANQAMGTAGWFQTPTGSLVGLWIVVLVLYWGLGIFFRGNRA